MIKQLRSILLLICLVSCTGADDDMHENEEIVLEEEEPDSAPFGNYKLYWNFADEFSEQEEEKLKKWIKTVGEATIKTLGQYPFDVYVTFHRSENKDVPVSFGHTDRGKTEGIHFYVTPSYSLEVLLADWTAPHEIAHLSLPFSGKHNRWFSEGYATYLSRQIMIEMGHFTEEEFDSMYTRKIHNTMEAYGSSTKTHLEVSDSLLDHNNYGDMYWGSSSFFFTADRYLNASHEMKFIEVVQQYQECCRMTDGTLDQVVASYDNIIGENFFVKLLETYRNQPSGLTMKNY